MFNLTRMQQYLLLGLAAVLILGASVVYWLKVAPTRQAVNIEPPPGTIIIADGADTMLSKETESGPQEIVIHVAGAVEKSGVYHLFVGDRVVDAITAAGGADAEADLDAINLAQPLIDGQKVWIPRVGEEPTGQYNGVSSTMGDSGKVNINTGDLTELQILSGIGPSLAQRIIDYRTNNGPFRQIEDIQNVSGIGSKRFEQLKDYITVY
ncbi:MAG: helix-hairpin-helix domain-containing protein [bacterium]